MSLGDAQVARALELFEGVPGLSTRRMFGGLGIYAEGRIFAVLMSDGTLRLKGAGGMPARYEALGMARWTYQRPGQRPAAMPYWSLPDDLLDDPEAASALAREALTHL